MRPASLASSLVHKRWKKQGEQDGVRRTLPCRDRRSPDPSALGGRWEGCGENSCDLGEFSVTGGGCNGTISMTRIPTAQTTRSETAAENFVPDALLRMRSNSGRYRHKLCVIVDARILHVCDSGQWIPRRPRNLPPAAAGRQGTGGRNETPGVQAFKRVGVSGFRSCDLFFGGLANFHHLTSCISSLSHRSTTSWASDSISIGFGTYLRVWLGFVWKKISTSSATLPLSHCEGRGRTQGQVN